MHRELFKEYEELAARADRAFEEVQRRHGSCIKCDIQCSDCCHSVFGLFLIESAYINHHFGKLERKIRREAISRGNKADRQLQEIQNKLQVYNSDPKLKALAMARERVRCPLLGDDERCVLYDARPITCRVYGIPTIISGRGHVCWQSKFDRDKSYPAFDLDAMYRELHRLSVAFLAGAGQQDPHRASLLLSMPRSINASLAGLVSGE